MLVPACLSVLVVVAAIGGRDALVSRRRVPPSVTISVRVRGATVVVPEGTNFGDLIHLEGLRPKQGRLLDVEGKALAGHNESGAVLLDGHLSSLKTPFAPGDRIKVIDGTDRTEATTAVRERDRSWAPGDPQFSLSVARHDEVITKGAVSGEVAGIRFVPTGRVKTPRAVALTFDDGPSATYTPQILRLLHRDHVPATFFVIGQLAERYPNLVRAEIRSGMSVGNHSWDHPSSPPFDQLEPLRVRSEISATDAELDRLGDHVHLFRPPGRGLRSRPSRIRTCRGLARRSVGRGPPRLGPGSEREADRSSGPRRHQARSHRRAARGRRRSVHDGRGPSEDHPGDPRKGPSPPSHPLMRSMSS